MVSVANLVMELSIVEGEEDSSQEEAMTRIDEMIDTTTMQERNSTTTLKVTMEMEGRRRENIKIKLDLFMNA